MSNSCPDDFMLHVLNKIDEGAYLIDRNRIVTFWNFGAEKISGFTADEVVGRSCADQILNHVDSSGNRLCGEKCPLLDVMTSGEDKSALVFLHHKNGSRIPVRVHAIPLKDEKERVTGVLEIFSDTSEVRLTRRKIDLLHEELYTDPLTNVGNRRFLDKELDRFFRDFNENRSFFAAVLCDIDDFKWVNDSYGHDFGDRVLAMTASTLLEALRDEDVVCRWGGEEFLLLLPGVQEEGELFSIVERLRILIRESFLTVHLERVSVTASFGVTSVKEGDDAATLFKRADRLLFRSKRKGKDRVTVG